MPRENLRFRLVARFDWLVPAIALAVALLAWLAKPGVGQLPAFQTAPLPLCSLDGFKLTGMGGESESF